MKMGSSDVHRYGRRAGWKTTGRLNIARVGGCCCAHASWPMGNEVQIQLGEAPDVGLKRKFGVMDE